MDEDVNPNKNCCTVCTGDRTDNIWYVNGKCKLDELTYEQVWYVLRRNPNAKKDLLRITSDPVLVDMANRTHLVETGQAELEQVSKRLNGGVPYYYQIRGDTDGKGF